jgi:excisionase family DNA binding protein
LESRGRENRSHGSEVNPPIWGNDLCLSDDYHDPMDDELITVPEAARRLGVTRQWILRLCAEGRIPAAKRIGRGWFLPAGEVEVLPLPLPPLRPRLPRASRMIQIPRVKGIEGSEGMTEVENLVL